MRTFIKICGITRFSDARSAVRAGAGALGFVFASSPRRVSVAQAKKIARRIHPAVRNFGVFVNASVEKILQVAGEVGLDGVQLHGDESREMVERLRRARPNLFIAKAIRALNPDSIKMADSFKADVILFDCKDVLDPLGPARTIPLEWLKGASLDRFVVAGGLNPENVGRVVRQIHPWGVDVSGGVEVSPGRKDPEKVRGFVRAVRAAESSPANE